MNRAGSLKREVSRFIAAQAMPGAGRYRYSADAARVTLYSSCYAALARSLLGTLGEMSAAECEEWAAYLHAHQDADGLYRDPVIFGQGWYTQDPLWCGRPHLTCHVLPALVCLGARAEKELRWLDPWRDPDRLVRWLESRDWGAGISWTGNEIMNVGTLLQYARDYQEDTAAGRAVAVLLEWLSKRHINPGTGVWGTFDPGDPLGRSHAVQAAYHWWALFFYDGVPIPSAERAIDTLLETQNELGGFGWGVHHPQQPFLSSACEDIDSLDPLARLTRVTPYRQAEVRAALVKGADWVLSNQAADGGFVFMREAAFEYGHAELRAGNGRGGMFPTWFRLLSLALLGRALPDHPLASMDWQFVNCPGMQFWRER
jgi:hypothetical protein